MGSPLREIRTAGSDWGDEYKKPCRLGEVAGAKAPPAARLRKGYRFEARLYRPRELTRDVLFRLRPSQGTYFLSRSEALGKAVRAGTLDSARHPAKP